MIDKYMLQFALSKGVGEVAIKKAISLLRECGCSWYDLIHDRMLLRKINVRDAVRENIGLQSGQAETLYNELNDNGIDILSENDRKYPEYLKKMLGAKCPPILFASGNIDLLNTLAVGFCGSRKTSEKGLSIASECAEQLVAQNITVVSGYAKGTDMSVHKAALKNGGRTICVLAEGILKYRKKREIREYISDDNCLYVSQFMPNTVWNSGNAMRRNSIIIGLSRAMILVESGKSGGTFSAGKEALRVHCPLFVIDFAQPEVSAEANPYFIKAGGTPIRGVNGSPNISKVLEVLKSDEKGRGEADTKKYCQIAMML